MNKIGIIGYGFVGVAVETGLQSIAEVRIHDKYKTSEALQTVVNHSDILFICLPTPMDSHTGQCDTSIIQNEVKNITKVARKSKAIVIKSTVPPGTTDSLQDQYPRHTFIFNPEFLTEKNFLTDFLEQDRIILGTPDKNFKQHNDNVLKVMHLYETFTKTQKKPAAIFDIKTKEAEMVKYIANCFLATKVMFFNEMYEICKAAGIDFKTVSQMACLDKRIGNSHTRVPGDKDLFGFGGSCFPKDINALIYFAKDNDVDPMIIESVWTKNLLVRQQYDWEKLAQVTGNYKKDDD